MLTIAQALLEARGIIDAVDARVLLGHALQVRKEYLATHPSQILSPQQAMHFRALTERRQQGEPVAHLTGRREFYGREFNVNADVLIPRPETELLVEIALQHAPTNEPCRILDLGTGSGAIAITLAQERNRAQVFAVDISESALDVARGNACLILGPDWASRLTLLRGHWYAPFSGQRFDLIVANPPYIAEGDPHLTQGDLRFEPKSALTPTGDGLVALREIFAEAPAFLEPGGWIICEHGYDQAAAVETFAQRAGFTEIRTENDLSNIPRVTLGRRQEASSAIGQRKW